MATNETSLLIFDLAGSCWGVPAQEIQELLPAVTLTPVPSKYADLEGLVNLRGTLTPVKDLRRLLNMQPKKMEPTDHLIIAGRKGQLVAWRVDRANEVLHLKSHELDSRASEKLGAIPLLSGIARIDCRVILILDTTILFQLPQVQGTEISLPAPETLNFDR